MIRLKKVSKIYEITSEISFKALTDISLRIEEGGFIGLVGPSGCGKSTLMHIIGLLEKPTSGNVWIRDQDTRTLSDTDLSHLRNVVIGFVFQQFNLINKLTVLENVFLPSMYAKRTSSEDYYTKALGLLNRFGIASKANSYPNKISGGEQQRAAIARALIMSPAIILADEPTGNLDSKNGQEILALLHDLNLKDKITLVIVTHDSQVAKKADRIIRLQDGKLI